MCILFDKCNLACKFCFEANKTKTIDYQYITNLPNTFWQQFSAREDQAQFNTIEITMMGGEVFNDVLPDSLFDTYQQVVDNTYQIFKDTGLVIKFNWLTNGVFKKRDRVDQLLHNTKSTISFSYDCVGRFPSNVQKNMMLENVKYYSNKKTLNAVLITPTKPSIEKYINGQSDIEFLRQYCNTLDLSYYIPGCNFQQLNPSDVDIFNFYKWIIDNRIFEFKDIREIIKPFRDDYQPQMTIYKTCNCDQLVNVTPNGCTNICVSINSPLKLDRFYGKLANNVNEKTIHLYRSTLGKQKRGCNTCEWNSQCVMPCWTAVLFDQFEIETCSLYKIYQYIKQNQQSIVDDYNHQYLKRHGENVRS